MSRSTISTFKLFELFPDEQSARKYLESRAPTQSTATAELVGHKHTDSCYSKVPETEGRGEYLSCGKVAAELSTGTEPRRADVVQSGADRHVSSGKPSEPTLKDATVDTPEMESVPTQPTAAAELSGHKHTDSCYSKVPETEGRGEYLSCGKVAAELSTGTEPPIDALLRIAERYKNCLVNIYPDCPEMTPVEGVIRCAREEGYMLVVAAEWSAREAFIPGEINETTWACGHGKWAAKGDCITCLSHCIDYQNAELSKTRQELTTLQSNVAERERVAERRGRLDEVKSLLAVVQVSNALEPDMRRREILKVFRERIAELEAGEGKELAAGPAQPQEDK